MTDRVKILEFIAKCDDAAQLRQLVNNAASKDQIISEAAFAKLISIVPGEKSGTLEHDMWKTINAFEYILSQERGKTVRLSRTRQKLARVGVVQTLADWSLGKPTDGFKMLIERSLPQLTGEAIVLRHSSHFSDEVLSAARKRFQDAGIVFGPSPVKSD